MGAPGVSEKFLGLPQFVVPRGCVGASDMLILEGREARHLSGARRLGPGKLVRVADGTGRVVVAQIEKVTANRVHLQVVEDLGVHDDLVPCTFLIALIKRERFEFALSRLSEMGISKVQPVITKRTRPLGLGPGKVRKRLERWQTICFESLKQSRGFKATEVRAPVSLDEAVEAVTSSAFKVALFAEKRGKGLGRTISAAGKVFPCAVAVGPEGGFEPEEKVFLKSMNFLAAGLGDRILRSETAAIYSAAVFSEIWLRKRCNQ